MEGNDNLLTAVSFLSLSFFLTGAHLISHFPLRRCHKKGNSVTNKYFLPNNNYIILQENNSVTNDLLQGTNLFDAVLWLVIKDSKPPIDKGVMK